MRDLKKYFFQSLLQLTILATVFRQNSRYTNLTSNTNNNHHHHHNHNNNSSNIFLDDSYSNYLSSSERNSTIGQLDLLLLRQNFNLNYTASDLNENSHAFLNANYRSKEAISYLKDLRLINLLNSHYVTPFAILNNPLPAHSPNLFLLPASFLNNSNNNQKSIVDLQETRFLLNSIELNLNNPILKKEFEMEIDLQTLIEQDIDLYKNQYYFGTAEQSLIDDPKQKCSFNKDRPSTSYGNEFAGLEFKHEDILSTTKYIEEEQVADDYNVFVEEDTGEILFILYENENQQKNYNLPFENTTQTDENLKYSFNYENYPSMFDMPVSDNLSETNKEDGLRIETNLAKASGSQPSPVAGGVPRFLSEISVCKTLDSLDKEDNDETNSIQIIQPTSSPSSPHQNNNNNIDEALLAFNDTLLNDFFQTNSLMDSDSHNYQSYEIQSDLYEQTQHIEPQASIQPAETKSNSSSSNIASQQLNLLSDQFLFEDQFLKEFEANLNKFDSNEFPHQNQINTTELQKSSIRNNQTIGGFLPDVPAGQHESPEYVSQEFEEQKIQIQDDTEPFSEQLNMNELFKLFDNSTNNISNSFVTTTNNVTYPTSHQVKSFLLDSSNKKATNATNDDEAKILNTFKQEKIEYENSNIHENNYQSSRFISTLNLPQMAPVEEMSAAMRGLQHNHTYLDGLKAADESETFHPYSYKNKLKKMMKNMDTEEANSLRQQESRDQLLLQENNIMASLSQVVDSNADDFNELVKELQLTAEQLTIIKDIRRRGKNKVAAQICRKRKIDSIESLKEDVDQLTEIKISLDSEHDSIQDEIRELTRQFDDLYKELIGENTDLNDPMLAYMSSLKVQLGGNNNNNNRKKPTKQNSVLRSLNSDHSDTNSEEYDSSDVSSSPEASDMINSVFEDVIELTGASSSSSSTLNLNTKIKKFRKY